MEGVLDIYLGFFDELSKKSHYLIPYLDRTASCEKWVQGEFIAYLYDLMASNSINNASLEKSYGRGKGRCDIWFNTNKGEIWCEMQVIVTKYHGRKKPMKHRVQHVINDSEKLGECPIPDAQRHLLFLTYPLAISGINDGVWESRHLIRILDVATLILEPYCIPINDEYEARIFLAKPI